MTTTYARMRQLTGTTAEWTTNDLVIGNGEIALERTSLNEVKIKVGDGATKFSALPYVTGSSAGLSAAILNELAKYLPLAGGTLTGDLQLRAQTAGVTVLPTSAVSRQWVENNSQTKFATIPEVTAVTRTDVAISPGTVTNAGISAGGAAADANRLVKTNSAGFVDNSFIKAVDTGGPANAGAIVKLDANGYVPTAVMPLSVQGAMYFKGEFDPSAGTEYPANPKQGDTWYVSNLNQYKFLAGDCANEVALHEDLMVFDGARWHLVGKEYMLQLLNAYVAKTDATATSTGVADAGKVVKLTSGGLIDSTMLAAIKAASVEHIDQYVSQAASGGKLIAADPTGYLSLTFLKTTNTFHGAADSGKLVAANAKGYVDTTLIESVNAFVGPSDAGKLVALGTNGFIAPGLLNAAQTSTGLPSAAKIVQLNSKGKVDTTMLDLPDVMSFKGTADISQAPPTGTHSKGEFYIASADTSTPNAGWNVPPGQAVKKGDGFIYTGTAWDFLEAVSAVDLTKVIHSDGTVAMTGELTLIDATQAQSAVPLHQVNALIAAQGATATTAIATAITTATTTAAADAAAKVAAAKTAADNAYVHIDGSKAMTGPLTLPGAPTNDLHAADKKYVDDGDAATLTTVAGLYQTKAAMAGYLLAATAATTYQTQAAAATAMGNYALKTDLTAYYTITAADTKFQTKADAATALAGLGTTYETSAHAAATYLSKTDAAGYETTAHASATYETTTHAAATYLSKVDAAGLYETQVEAAKHALKTDFDAYKTATDAKIAALTTKVTALETLLAGVTRTGNNVEFPGDICGHPA